MLVPGKETKENRRHGTTYVPYSYYDCHMPELFPNVPMHWHDEVELGLVTQGSGRFICDGESITLHAGDMVLLPPNTLHSVSPDETLRYFALVFHPSMLGVSAGDRCAVECLHPFLSGNLRVSPCVSTEQRPDLLHTVEEVMSCAVDEHPQAELLLRSGLLRLLWVLETDPSLPRQERRSPPKDDIVRPAMEYILGHYSEPLTIHRMAQHVNLSDSYFMSLFKKAVGVSAIEYLCELRVNAACEALTSTNRSVSEIAFSVGFGNLSNFNRQFRRSVGCTPGEFRRRIGVLEYMQNPSL